jgi:hypothetical protein
MPRWLAWLYKLLICREYAGVALLRSQKTVIPGDGSSSAHARSQRGLDPRVQGRHLCDGT